MRAVWFRAKENTTVKFADGTAFSLRRGKGSGTMGFCTAHQSTVLCWRFCWWAYGTALAPWRWEGLGTVRFRTEYQSAVYWRAYWTAPTRFWTCSNGIWTVTVRAYDIKACGWWRHSTCCCDNHACYNQQYERTFSPRHLEDRIPGTTIRQWLYLTAFLCWDRHFTVQDCITLESEIKYSHLCQD